MEDKFETWEIENIENTLRQVKNFMKENKNDGSALFRSVENSEKILNNIKINKIYENR